MKEELPCYIFKKENNNIQTITKNNRLSTCEHTHKLS